MATSKLTIEQVEKFLSEIGEKQFSVIFFKTDGSLRAFTPVTLNSPYETREVRAARGEGHLDKVAIVTEEGYKAFRLDSVHLLIGVDNVNHNELPEITRNLVDTQA